MLYASTCACVGQAYSYAELDKEAGSMAGIVCVCMCGSVHVLVFEMHASARANVWAACVLLPVFAQVCVRVFR